MTGQSQQVKKAVNTNDLQHVKRKYTKKATLGKVSGKHTVASSGKKRKSVSEANVIEEKKRKKRMKTKEKSSGPDHSATSAETLSSKTPAVSSVSNNDSEATEDNNNIITVKLPKPKELKTPTSNSVLKISKSTLSSEKRKPGRPKKNADRETPSSIAKKSPGRPKKILTETTSLAAVKKSPGRPRKNQSIESAKKILNKSKFKSKLSVSQLVKGKSKTHKFMKNRFKIKLNSPMKKHSISTPSEMEIETESSDSEDDDNVRYFLSDADTTTTVPEAPDQPQTKSDNQSSENITINKKKRGRPKMLREKDDKAGKEKVQKPRVKKIKMLDALHSGMIKPAIPVRPVSPTPQFMRIDPGAATATILPNTSSSPLVRQPQWVILEQDESPTAIIDQQASLPMSPASMSYKMLLDSLPQQLHPRKASKKVEETDEDVERRLSVRATECAFRYKEIVIKKCNKYTQIWLNTHTKMKNALSPLVMQEICSALNAAKYDDSNLLMFSGLGNVFCSGIDLQYLTLADRKVAARKMADALRDLVRKFIMFPKPIIAVVTGPAVGLGCSLLPLCDIVYASDKATFYMPYTQLAQTPEGCASYTLQNCVGNAMANELLLGGRKITAIEACQLGLVSQVFWPTSMMQEVIPRVQHMALMTAKVLETTKLLMRSHHRTKLDLTNESECNLLVERWPATDCQRAITEFLCNEKNYSL